MAIRHVSALLGALALCWPSNAAADYVFQYQYIGPWDFNTPWIASESINQTILQNMLEDGVDQASNPDVADDNAPPQSASAPSAAPNLGFRFSAERSERNLRAYLAGTHDPAARDYLERLVAARPGLMDDIGRSMRRFGFDPHNTADAYAAWLVSIWGISEKRNIEPDPATVEAVKRQVRGTFAAVPEFANTSDAERQEYAEALILKAALLGHFFELVKHDPDQLDQLAQVARQGAEDRGIDLSLMTLTINGFVPRQGR